MSAVFTAATGADSHSYLYPPQIGGGSGDELVGTLNLGNPYATDGVAVTAATFRTGATTIVEVLFDGVSADGTIRAVLNAAKTKVIAYNASGTQLANATDLSAAGKSVRCRAIVT